ncbi:DUF6415 family natural product biosynthesis protein [Streptomyces sp. NBC_01471]|uniref:DUF6415 family natural product biosynthesis protein n=1 Tax=Streptomyces sp. NBC_01471 TaxID=2903879 RepID=UPI00325121E9
MIQATGAGAPLEDDLRPLDFETMRAIANRLLAQGQALSADDLLTEIMMLRGQLAVLVPAVSELAGTRPVDDVWRDAAQECVGTARRRITHTTGYTVPVLLTEIQGLARSVLALGTHLRNLAADDA